MTQELKIDNKIGDIIASLRTSRDLSQQQFAKKIGISQPQLSAIESGRQEPKLQLLLTICKALELDPLAFALRLLTQSFLLKGVGENVLGEDEYIQLSMKLRNGVEDIFKDTLVKRSQEQIKAFEEIISNKRIPEGRSN